MENPLSPHLQIYRLQITSVMSILHRVSGVVTSLGSIILVTWLLALGLGEEALNFINSIFFSFLGRAVLIGFTLAVCFNVLNDIRHLFWDYGYGFSLNAVKISGLLTFDTNFMIWGILKNFKYINILNHMWTPKTYEMLEEDLIKNLKFLNLEKQGLEIYLKNNFQEWRYFNKNLGELFGYRYQANLLVTNNYDEFENEKIKKFIKSSLPSLNQQIAIVHVQIKNMIKFV